MEKSKTDETAVNGKNTAHLLQNDIAADSENLFRSRLSPTLADAFATLAFRSQFAAFLAQRNASSLLHFWVEADKVLKTATSLEDTLSSMALDISEKCNVSSNVMRPSDLDKGIAHCKWVVADELQRKYFDDFCNSSHFANYQLELLHETLLSANVIDESPTNHTVLNDIVFSDTALFHFREFIEQLQDQRSAIKPQYSKSAMLAVMLNFYIAAASFARGYISDNAHTDALTIYNQYLSLQVDSSIALPDAVRQQIEENISPVTGRPLPSAFDAAVSYVCKILSGDDVLGQFFHSLHFNQLIASIRRRASNGQHQSGNGRNNNVLAVLPSNQEDDVVSSGSSNKSGPSKPGVPVRRVTSLRLARIDPITGAYISDFNCPKELNSVNTNSQNVKKNLAVPNSQQQKGSIKTANQESSKIRRMFSLRGSSSSKMAQHRNEELEAERTAVAVVDEILSLTSPTPTPRSSMALDF